jgi:hypothetical protein
VPGVVHPAVRNYRGTECRRPLAMAELLEAPDRSTPIDAVVALAMAIDRHAYQPEPVEGLGWM